EGGGAARPDLRDRGAQVKATGRKVAPRSKSAASRRVEKRGLRPRVEKLRLRRSVEKRPFGPRLFTSREARLFDLARSASFRRAAKPRFSTSRRRRDFS